VKLLNDYFQLQKEIYQYFGYLETWKVFPIDDSTEYFWKIDHNQVKFADTEIELKNENGNYYENSFYSARNQKDNIYRGAEYTMIAVDTNTDGNKFLQIFSNSKELK